MKTDEIGFEIKPGLHLKGNLVVPYEASALIIFSHGSGSSRMSSRNRYVAQALNKLNMATLLVDLLTEEEDHIYETRFDIELLTTRLVEITRKTIAIPGLQHLPVGYFGASTGAASALKAARKLDKLIHAVVSRGGRPDLAEPVLPQVKAPTLLIVGSLDTDVILLNKTAFEKMNCEKQLTIVKGASHLFEEPGKLDDVVGLASSWFTKHLVEKFHLI